MKYDYVNRIEIELYSKMTGWSYIGVSSLESAAAILKILRQPQEAERYYVLRGIEHRPGETHYF